MEFLKAASRGSGPKSFTVRLPFFLSPKAVFKELQKLEDIIQIPVSFDRREGFIEKQGVQHLITVPDFKSEAEARLFLSRLGIGFVRFAANQKVGLQFDLNPDEINEEIYKNLVLMAGQSAPKGWTVSVDTRFIDGVVLPYQTAIIPEHKKIIDYPSQMVEWNKLIELIELEKAFVEGLQFSAPEKIFADKKIRLALEVFTGAFYHRDVRVTLINLVTVLEILSEEKKTSKTAGKLLDRMQRHVRTEAARRKTARGKAPFEVIAKRLDELRRISISEAFRNLIYESGDTGLNRAESDKIAKEIYDIRSKLVHTGIVKAKGGILGELRIIAALAHLEKLTPTILENRIKSIAGI